MPAGAPCAAACAHLRVQCVHVLTRAARSQALEGIAQGPLEQVPIQDYFPEAAELSPVEFAESATAR